jgi:archaellum component FlaC
MRMARLEERMDRLEERMDRLEARVDRLEIRVTEGFLTVDERYAILDLRLEQLDEKFTDMREQFVTFGGLVGGLDRRVGIAAERVERVDGTVMQLSIRFTDFVEDVRQRFRAMSEQLN